MNKKVALIAAGTLAGGTLIAAAPAQAFEMERERSKMCSTSAFATLSLEKEWNRIDVEADIENATPGRSWNVRIKHNGTTVLRSARMADYEGELETMQQVSDRPGKDRFTAQFRGPSGEQCRIKLGI
jgi:hypothetical protein